MKFRHMSREDIDEQLPPFDSEGEALLRHILDDGDSPPQGLHQQGFKPFGNPSDEEDEEFWNYKYPPLWED